MAVMAQVQFHGSSSGSRRCGASAMRASTSASQCQPIDLIELGRHDQCIMIAARSARVRSHRRATTSAPAQIFEGAFGRIVGEADPSIFDEAGKPVPTPEHVIDRLRDRGRARQAGTFLTQPRLQSGQKRRGFVPGARAGVLRGCDR